jgi:Zn-dependent protease
MTKQRIAVAVLSFLLSVSSFYIVTKSIDGVISIMFAVTIHELAHIYVLHRFGITHMSLIFIPLIGAFVSLSSQDRRRLSRPQMGLVAFAGPFANFLLMGASIIFFASTGLRFWLISAAVNSVFAAVNLLPIPMLDGKKIVEGFFWWLPKIGFRATGVAAILPLLVILGVTILDVPYYYHVLYAMLLIQGVLLYRRDLEQEPEVQIRWTSKVFTIAYFVMILFSYLISQLLPNTRILLQVGQ